MSQRSCCVPTCAVTRGHGVPLHRFPNPSKSDQIERFRTWIMKIGGEIVGFYNLFIHKNRRICHRHFEEVYTFPNGKLSGLAVPTLNIPGVHVAATRNEPMAIVAPQATNPPPVGAQELQQIRI